MATKDARVDIKTTKAAKAELEQAANVLGTTLSAFMLECAMHKARKILAEKDMIKLARSECERFVAALDQAPNANAHLTKLFKKHNVKKNQKEV